MTGCFQKIRTGWMTFGMMVVSLAILAQSVPISAQETDSPSYAPLIDEETRSILKINVETTDIPLLIQKMTAQAISIIEKQVVDKGVAKQYKTMIPLMLAGYSTNFSLLFDALREAKIPEFYFIWTPSHKNISPGFLAIPTGSRTKDELQKIYQNVMNLRGLGIPFRQAFVRHGFLIAPLVSKMATDDDFRNYVRAKFTKLATAANPMFDKEMGAHPDSPFVFVFANDPSVVEDFNKSFQELGEAVVQSNDQEALNFQKMLANRLPSFISGIQKIAAYGDRAITTLDVVIQMKTAEDASKIVSGLEEIKKESQKIAETKNPELAGTIGPVVGRLIDVFTPAISGENVSWKFDAAFVEKGRPVFDDYLSLLREKTQNKTAENVDSAPEKKSDTETSN